MPSDVMDPKQFSSSSFFSDEAGFANERQVGFWKSDTSASHYDNEKLVASSPYEKFMTKEGQIMNSYDRSESSLMQDQKVKAGMYRNAVGAERAASRSTMSRSLELDAVHPMPYFSGSNRIGMMGAHYENNLFSSSLSDLFNQKLKLPPNKAPYGHSVDTVGSQYQEEEPLESTKEIEAQTIGNLLPDDDDLLSGVTEGLDYIVQPNSGDDLDELDFFNSVGGMDLGDDSSSLGQRSSEFPGITYGQLGSQLAGEHPCGEHPSRTLFVRNINSNVEDSELKTLFEQYGDIRTLYTVCKHRGFVMISYYDIRAARNAMKALQNKPLKRRKLDIHYSIPKDNPSDKDVNQGTLVAFNLDASISSDELLQIFGVYGEIKEVRETPHRSHHKFIEFYDTRAAEAALRELNNSDIAGKRIKVEASRPGGARRLVQQFPSELDQDDVSYLQHNSPPDNSKSGFSGLIGHGTPTSTTMNNGTMFGMHSSIRSPIHPFLETAFHQGISSSVPNSLPSLVRVQSVGNQSCLAESGHSQGTLKFDIRSSPNFNPHSLPEYQDGLTNSSSTGAMTANIGPRPVERFDNRQFSGISLNGHSVELNEGVFGSLGSSGNGSCPLPGHHYAWSNSYRPQPPGSMWPTNSPSASFANGMSTHLPPTARLHGLPRAPPHTLNAVVPTNHHHVGSAPAVNHSVWDRRHSYAGESHEAFGFHPGSLGNARMSSGNSLHSMELASQNAFPHHGGGNGMDMQTHHQRSMMFPGRSQMIPTMNSFEPPNERVRSRRNEGGSNQADNKKQYELDIERIKRGEDTRTTLMIKNIPNKYTSKMLLAAIDENHRGTYDFLYLPIDFKNKCNVGYAFINMTDPRQIVPFYQAFNGKKWEKFNSEKVASLAYGRIQGKSALISHFQNSSLMNEDKRCRPILFNTDGPNAGDQVPFPMGVNIRTRPTKTRPTTQEENHEGTSSHLANGDYSFNADSSSGSGRESD